MTRSLPFYIEVLGKEFEERKRKNARYSTRAFSQSLGINSGTLSSILNGTRKPTQKQIEVISQKLRLNKETEQKLLESIREPARLKNLAKLPTPDDSFDIDVLYEKIVADWRYFATLALITTKDFKYDEKWISKRLGITVDSVRQTLSDLRETKYIEITPDNQIKITAPIGVNRTASLHNQRKATEGTLELALRNLHTLPPDLGYYSAMTIAIDPAKISEIRALMSEFRGKLALHLKDCEKKEVYKIALLAFPISE